MKIAYIFAFIMLLGSLSFAQKLTVVVGAVSEDPKPGLRKNLETQIKTAFVKDERFTAVTREEAVLALVDREHIHQRSGAVDDGQIRQLGVQTGARYVCVVEISPLMDSYMLSAQFIDIESAKIITMANVPSVLKNQGDFLAASEELVRRLLGRSDSDESNYGSGIFLKEPDSDNPISRELAEILKQKVTVSDGTCVGGVTASLESASELSCVRGMVGIVCKADVSLTITQCKGGQKIVLKSSVVGSDKNSADAATRQFLRNIENAQFWNEWVKALEERAKR